MSDLGSYKSNVNPKVDAAIRIAANSKTDRVCSSDKEKTRENTRECINNMEEARKKKKKKVAKRVTEKLDRARIKGRQEIDWGYTCFKETSANEREIGD